MAKTFRSRIIELLILLSFVFYGIALIMPFLNVQTCIKVGIPAILIPLGEGVWWIGIALAGKELAYKIRKNFNPLKLISCKK